MSNCEKCGLRARYENKPRSLLGRLWKWHIRWCPGWKSYLRSMPQDRREMVENRYR